MRRIVIFVLACFPLLSYSAQTMDELKARNPELCQGIVEPNGNSGRWECLNRMRDDSEKQLAARLTEIRVELKNIGDDYVDAFEKDQRAWEAYKAARCEYLTIGTEKDSYAYDLHGTMCQISENYRRIDTLKREPSFS